ncbi:MAG TPA: BspA family leucine-rich repeat surface protein [bacterium]|nr:BspA family leucine-rich repeat surface protein [bacterium]
MAVLVLIILGFFYNAWTASAYDSDLFVTSWKTNTAGATEPTKVSLSFQVTGKTGYYEIDWRCNGDFKVIYDSGKQTYDYNQAGTYNICIRTLSPIAFYAPDLSANEKDKLQEIKQWGGIKWSSFNSAFQGMKNMRLTASDAPILTGVQDMYAAFEDTANFAGNDSMSVWNTVNVTRMQAMFRNAPKFNAPIGNWDTRNVTNMSNMFQGATVFNQPIGGWKTNEVTNMSGMFNSATKFNQPIGDWNVKKVANMSGMFMMATAFNQDIGTWETESLSNMAYMFRVASSFNKNINSWNVSKIKVMDRLFDQATAFNQPLNNWDTSNVTNMTGMFRVAYAFNQNLSAWKTPNLIYMNSMFYEARSFNNGEGPGESTAPLTWNTIQATSMQNMFQGAIAFNQPIGSWDTRSVTHAAYMFNNAKLFNQPLNSWNTKSLTTTLSMFQGASAFDQPLDNWNTSSVTNMNNMFHTASAFNQPLNPQIINSGQPDEYSSWDVSGVISMSAMFYQATNFNGALDQWNTAKVELTNSMFVQAINFNQPVGNWNMAKVTNMYAMFSGALSFDQDISTWNIEQVTNFSTFLNNSRMSIEHYDALLNKWSTQDVQPNLSFGAVGLYYCTAQEAKNTLTSPTTHNWNITDAGKNCRPYNLCLSNAKVNENTTAVGTVSATDEGPLKYTLFPGVGGEDNAKFVLNLTTGVLTFAEPPDFENPLDLGDTPGDNTYSILVHATDELGVYAEKVFIITVLDVDDVAPVITIHPGIKLSKGPISDTTFTVSDRYSIKEVKVDSSSTAAADRISCQAAEGATTQSRNFPFINDRPDPDNHLVINCTIRITSSGTLVLRATDRALYSSTTAEPGYTIDTLGPTFLVANVDITQYGLHKPVVKFKAVDPVGVSGYELRYIADDGEPGHSSVETVDFIPYQSGILTQTLILDEDQTQHTVNVVAYDTANNMTVRPIVFPPEVTIIAPTVSSNGTINDTTVTITTPEDGNRIDQIDITGSAADGVHLGTCQDRNEKDRPPFDTTVTCEVLGIHTTGMVTIMAKDIDSGAVGHNSQKYFQDVKAPTIVITAPTKTSKEDITDITIAITDDIELYTDSISIAESSSAGAKDLVCQTSTIDDNRVDCTVTVTKSGDLAITATDKAKNSYTKIESGFLIDRIAPVVAVNLLTPVTSNNQESYNLSGTCTAGDGDLLITLDEQPHSTPCDIDGNWSLIVDLTGYSDGDIATAIKQTDAVGNVGTARGNLFKDTVAPIAGLDHKTTNIASPQLTGPISENTATLAVAIGGKTYSADNLGNGTWELKTGKILPPLVDGVYEVEVTATDDIGNTIIFTFPDAITVDTVRPTVTVEQAATQADPTNVNRAEFVAKFSKDMDKNTISPCEFTLKGTTTGTMEITKVNPREFMIVVTGMSDGDTVKVSLAGDKVKDSVGNFNIASTSTDNAVTYKIGDETISPESPPLPPDSDTDQEQTSDPSGADEKNTTTSTTTPSARSRTKTSTTSRSSHTNSPEMSENSSSPLLKKEVFLGGRPSNKGQLDVVNKAIISVLGGTCQARFIEANSLDSNLQAPERNVEILGGITYKLDCEKLGGDATVGIILGEYYPNTNLLRIYKKQNEELVDITSNINLRNETSTNETKMSLRLVDGADYDDDNMQNYEILDPLYIGIYKERATRGCFWKCIILLVALVTATIISFRIARKKLAKK